MEQNDSSPQAGRFDIEGAALCLDFCNTVNWHASEHPEDSLIHFSDLVDWGVEANVLTLEQGNDLKSLAGSMPSEASRWFSDALVLREAIYRIFSAISNERPSKRLDFDILTTFWRQAAQSMRIQEAASGLTWSWEFKPGDLGRILWPIALSAVDLLGSDQRSRVGECQDDRGCGFLFIDTSRNHSRRWCSMDSCGNRAKAMRHYTRAKLEEPEED